MMRRIILAVVAGGALLAAATLGGCPAAHDDYPGVSCKTNNDCFKGEVCSNSICQPATPPQDMSIILPPQDLLGVGDMAMPQDAGDDLL
jgi:hypothetical protein